MVSRSNRDYERWLGLRSRSSWFSSGRLPYIILLSI